MDCDRPRRARVRCLANLVLQRRVRRLVDHVGQVVFPHLEDLWADINTYRVADAQAFVYLWSQGVFSFGLLANQCLRSAPFYPDAWREKRKQEDRLYSTISILARARISCGVRL